MKIVKTTNPVGAPIVMTKIWIYLGPVLWWLFGATLHVELDFLNVFEWRHPVPIPSNDTILNSDCRIRKVYKNP